MYICARTVPDPMESSTYSAGCATQRKRLPVPHMVHQISSAPGGRCTVWVCTHVRGLALAAEVHLLDGRGQQQLPALDRSACVVGKLEELDEAPALTARERRGSTRRRAARVQCAHQQARGMRGSKRVERAVRWRRGASRTRRRRATHPTARMARPAPPAGPRGGAARAAAAWTSAAGATTGAPRRPRA